MSIQLTGVSNSYPLPGELAETIFAAGGSSGATAQYNAILMGNKLSTGSATLATIYGPTTPIALTSESDAIALFGAGSELHGMARRFFTLNTSTPLSAIAIAEGAGAAATGTITVANIASGYSTLRIYLQDDFVDVGIASGDGYATVASNIVSAVNSKTYWPASASTGSNGIVTLTAKQLGLRGNLISFQTQLKPSNITTTVTGTASAFLTSGTVSDDNTNALAAMLPYNFYYIISAAEDVTNLGRLKTQIATQSLPVNGIRQRNISGSNAASVSTINTIANGLNDPRGCVAWQMSSDVQPCNIAATLGAVISLIESDFNSSTLNFDSFGGNAKTSALWPIKAPRSGIAPTKLQQVSALNNGVTPIASTASGSSYIVKLITLYSLNGSTPDYRVRDWCTVSISDHYTNDILQDAADKMRSKTVSADPVNNESPPPGSITPSTLKAMINRRTRDYFESGLLTNIATIISNTIVQYDPINTPNRLTALIPLQPIKILDQVAFSIQSVA
jgi:phage tail sheath gpL-like